MLSKDVASIIFYLLVIMGSDHTTGFYGHCKEQLLQVVSDPQARVLLGRVAASQVLLDKVRPNMKTFAISKFYSESSYITRGQARASKWHKMKKSTAPFTPDEETLHHNVEWTNIFHVTYCQLH